MNGDDQSIDLWGIEMEAQVLAWHAARRKARMLRWVNRQMRRRLTVRERTCLRMFYLREMSYAQIGRQTGTHPSSACRAVQRGLRKLRQAAREDTNWRERGGGQ